MKKILAVSLIVFSVFSNTNTVALEKDALCGMIAQWSELIMAGRQSGIKIEVQLKSFDSEIGETLSNFNSETRVLLKELSRNIIIEAYQERIWPVKELQNDAIDKFRNKMAIECLKNY